MPYLIFLLCCSLLFTNSAAAFPRLIFEKENNDTPENAQPFRGEARLVGNVSGDQDMYLWQFDDVESDNLWNIELQSKTEGIVRLDLVALAFNEEGGVIGRSDLLTLRATAGNAVLRREHLMIPQGELYVGLSSAGGGGDYEVTLEAANLRLARGRLEDIDGEFHLEPNRHPRILDFEESEVNVFLIKDAENKDLLHGLTLKGELTSNLEATIVSADGDVLGTPMRGSSLQHRWSRVNLDEGSFLRVRNRSEHPVGRLYLHLEPDGIISDTEETEPNNTPEQANWTTLLEGFSGILDGRRDTDYLAFSIDAELAEAAQTIHIDTNNRPLTACLSEVASARDEVCRTGHSNIFSNMQLAEGDYYLKLSGAREVLPYKVHLEVVDKPDASMAIEPNDARKWASPLQERRPVRGRINGDRKAYFELLVRGEPQYWRFQANGDDVRLIEVYEDGQRRPVVASDRGRGRSGTLARLDRVLLFPGRYHIALRGSDSDYTFRAIPMGLPESGFEQEPNDTEERANRLNLGETMQGTLHSSSDTDLFYFTMPGWNRVQIELQAPADGDVRAQMEWIGERMFLGRLLEKGESQVYAGFLPPGDYIIRLDGDTASDLEYKLTASVTSPWERPDKEIPIAPNTAFAATIPESGELFMDADHPRGQVWYTIPAEEHKRSISFNLLRRTSIEWLDKNFEPTAPEHDEESDVYSLDLPANESLYFLVRSIREAGTIEFEGLKTALTEAPELNIELDETVAAAGVGFSQTIGGRLKIANPLDSEQTFSLQFHSSDGLVTVDHVNEATLAAGEEATLPISIKLPPALDDRESITVWARSSSAVSEAKITLDPNSIAIEPLRVHAVDEDLRGLPDLAWSGLGARFVDSATGKDLPHSVSGEYSNLQLLIDGMAPTNSALTWGGELGDDALPVLALAGGKADIKAVVFNQESPHSSFSRWSRVQVEISTDGMEFSKLMDVELEPGSGDQVFRAPAGTEGSYIRLRPMAIWGGERARRGTLRRNGTGLFRVLGLPAEESEHLKRVNILEPALGGHVIHAEPIPRRAKDILEGSGRQLSAVRRSDEQLLVLGFFQHRAALIEELSWLDEAEDSDSQITRIGVETSRVSSAGPWKQHHDWILDRDSEGDARYQFDEPVHAKNIRLRIQYPEESNSWTSPVKLAAFEAKSSLVDRRSITGYWGHYTPDGPMEAEWEPPQLYADESVTDSTSSTERPHMLDSEVFGVVLRPGDERAYTITVPEDQNTLTLTLGETSFERLLLELKTDQGRQQIPDWEVIDSYSRKVQIIGLDPGEHTIVVSEPPRTVVVAWDASGSVAHHQAAIFQAIKEFSEDLRADEEEANLMALGGPLLINGWAQYPLQLARTMGTYDDRFNSSDSELAMGDISEAFLDRPGERVIFMITDGEFNRQFNIMNLLEEARPRTFIIGLDPGGHGAATEKVREEQQILQAWAHINNGDYWYTGDRNQILRAFRQAMIRVRQPSRFRLTAETEWQEPPSPGQLHVTSGEVPVVAAGVVHFIFDASGSMLRRMTGGRRIDVAKQVVRDTLGARIPEDIPIALRAFGHTEPHSCETELLIAPTQGNQSDILAAVNRIQAINLARTPLAASLDAVEADLADFPDSRRLVVLFTDGEETCDGDVAESVAQLMESGTDVRINIVGFHIDQAELRRKFRSLAAEGGGEYFNSDDGDELTEALVASLAASYRVLDSTGRTVARGRVDDEPVELESGSYTLIVESGNEDIRKDITIRPDALLEVSPGSL